MFSSSDQQVNKKIAIFGLVVGLITTLLSFFELASSVNAILIRGMGVVTVLGTLFWLFRKSLPSLYLWLYRRLDHMQPWFVFLILIIGIFIYQNIKPSTQITHIPFNRGNGAIFNSWQHQSHQNKHVIAFGNKKPLDLMWVIDEYGTAHFSYETDLMVLPNDSLASSGGYLTFYRKPCDRLLYREISFDCRATNVIGMADVGIRLAVDNPNATGDRERVTYEIPSLKSYYNGKRSVDGNWQNFSIGIGDFTQTRVETPLPQGVDENTINKVVFFVNLNIIKNCPKATLWFRDITFKSEQLRL